MNEYWSKDDVIENAFLDLQHERDALRAELARLKEDNEKWRQLLKTQTSIFRDLTDKIEKLKEDAEMKLE